MRMFRAPSALIQLVSERDGATHFAIEVRADVGAHGDPSSHQQWTVAHTICLSQVVHTRVAGPQALHRLPQPQTPARELRSGGGSVPSKAFIQESHGDSDFTTD